MSCNFYVHNIPNAGVKYISGTTCSGSVTATTLSFGEEICMDNSKPIINLNNLQIGESCFPVTPTPTPTAPVLCYYSGRTYETADFQCPNNGSISESIYGKLTFRVSGGAYPGDHPDYSIVVSNGFEFETILLPRGQEFIEYVYLQTDFRFDGVNCSEVVLTDWYFVSVPNIPDCQACELEGNATYYIGITRTPTPTPTNTSTPPPTPTQRIYSYYYQLAKAGSRPSVCIQSTTCGPYYLNSTSQLQTLPPGQQFVSVYYCTDLNKDTICNGKDMNSNSVAIISEVPYNPSYPLVNIVAVRNNCGSCPN